MAETETSTYTFACSKCGHVYDVRIPLCHEEELIDTVCCPRCDPEGAKSAGMNVIPSTLPN